MDVSRSGRVRKKSSKLADFESPDEIEIRQDDPPKNKKIKGDVSCKIIINYARQMVKY